MMQTPASQRVQPGGHTNASAGMASGSPGRLSNSLLASMSLSSSTHQPSTQVRPFSQSAGPVHTNFSLRRSTEHASVRHDSATSSARIIRSAPRS
jgi:hypothetical protein